MREGKTVFHSSIVPTIQNEYSAKVKTTPRGVVFFAFICPFWAFLGQIGVGVGLTGNQRLRRKIGKV